MTKHNFKPLRGIYDFLDPECGFEFVGPDVSTGFQRYERPRTDGRVDIALYDGTVAFVQSAEELEVRAQLRSREVDDNDQQRLLVLSVIEQYPDSGDLTRDQKRFWRRQGVDVARLEQIMERERSSFRLIVRLMIDAMPWMHGHDPNRPLNVTVLRPRLRPGHDPAAS